MLRLLHGVAVYNTARRGGNSPYVCGDAICGGTGAATAAGVVSLTA